MYTYTRHGGYGYHGYGYGYGHGYGKPYPYPYPWYPYPRTRRVYPYPCRSLAADVDSIVSAQIPDRDANPVLYNIITQNMVHGPCGAAKPDAKCMVDGHCSKHYRKEFCENTQYGDDGYPKYARPNNGRSFEKNGFEYDNRDVVPYNAYLSAKYNCHINVEICAAVEAVKYIHKYIYKGHDRTTLEISGDQQRDEIKEYLDARYISAAESCWHIFEFSMHSESPTVYRLPVHLEDRQLVYYNADDDVDEVLGRETLKKTPLTEWFKSNETYPEARNTAYQDFPKKWVYDKKVKKWHPRKCGAPAIGRMYFASPAQGEQFYLRMLLTTVTGATSFANLRSVNHIQYGTFKEACHALGLLENGNEWIQCLTEAGEIQTGSSLRSLFAIILLCSTCDQYEPEIDYNIGCVFNITPYKVLSTQYFISELKIPQNERCGECLTKLKNYLTYNEPPKLLILEYPYTLRV